MAISESRYSAEETAQRGDEIYARQLRALLEPQQRGKIVAIDVDTGSYAVGETAVTASKQLLARQADAQIWLVRVGEPVLHRIGSWDREEGR